MGHIPRSDEPTPPPGWYPDPRSTGMQRWWDGTQWVGDSRYPPSKGPPYRFLWWIGAGVLAAITVGALSDGNGSTPSGSDVGAMMACEEFVERQLRAPATADFPSHRDSDISQSGDRYTVRAYVDAENAFGATIRTDWTCTVTPTDDGWEGTARLLE